MRTADFLAHADDAKYLGRSVIYMITIADKFYIGSAKNFRRRTYEHLKIMKAGRHHSSYLQNCYNKYGDPRFHVIEVLPRNCSHNHQLHVEQHYLDLLGADELCMNMRLTAESGGCENARAVVVDGKEFRTVTDVAEHYGTQVSTVTAWLRGKTSLPRKFGITSLRYADETESKVFSKQREKPVVLDGVRYASVVEAAEVLNVPPTYVTYWLKGRCPVFPGIHFTELRYADEETSKVYRNERCHPVILDGERFESVRLAAESIGVQAKVMSEWLSGRQTIPLKFPIKSLHYEGQPSRIRVKPQRKPISVDGVVYPTVNDAAAAIGVRAKQVSKWLCNKAPIPVKYNIHSLHYA